MTAAVAKDTCLGVFLLGQMVGLALLGAVSIMSMSALGGAAYGVGVGWLLCSTTPTKRLPVGVSAVAGVTGATIARIIST